jgi:hypothetical protein
MRDKAPTIDRVAHQLEPEPGRPSQAWTGERTGGTEVFIDPVGYLAALGIESVLVVEQPGAIPTAA